MVDLVKIRKKKAKEKEEAANAAAGSGGAAAASAAESAPTEQAAPSADTSNAGRPAAEAAAAPQERAADAPALAQSTADQQPATTPAAINKLDRFKQEAGKRRGAETIAQEEEETSSQLELLTFAIAREHYAVDIERIVEIVTPRPVTRIPNADPSVVGIISLRGTIVTLVDVRRKLRHPAAGEADAETRIVVIDFHHEMVGFLVDRVLRVVKTTPGAIEPHPVVHAAELDDSVRGVFLTGGALTILLDLDKLLDHSALAATTA